MVSIQEAKNLVVQRQQEIQTQRQQVQEVQREIRETQLRALTRTELQKRGREDIITRKLQTQQLEGLKETQLSQLKPLEAQIDAEEVRIKGFQQEIQSVEARIAEQKKRQKSFEQAKKLFVKGLVDPGASPQTKKFLREFEAKREISLTKAIREGVEEAKKLAQETSAMIKKETTVPNGKSSTILTQAQIDKLNIKDPLKFFIVSTLPEFGRTIFEDFVNNPKDRKAIRDSLSKLQKKGDETIEKLEDTRVKVEEFLDPQQKRFRIETEKNFDILTGTQEVLNTDIEKFNKKFVGELSQEQFDEATLKATTFTARQRSIDQKTFELAEKVKRLREASEFQVETFFKSTLKGIVTSPVTLAQLGIAASTRPIKTTKDFTKAVKEFPSTFGTVPFSTAGEIFGTVVGTKLITDFVIASPQLFKGSRVPIGKADLRDALRKGGKKLDNVIEELKKFAKDKKGEITITTLIKKKKKKKKKSPLEELTEILEDLDEIGDVKAKNRLIDDAVKGMLTKIRESKTLAQKQQRTLALNKIMKIWKDRKIIKSTPPIFELTKKPTRPIGSK
ncbi:hypothetical protein LCGC14_2203990, partial [marine sediment metagenome]